MGAPARRRSLTFYTSNPGKVREVRHHLLPLGFEVKWGRRRLFEPQANGLEEVVRWKLRQVPPSSGWSMVEDSGLFVDALKGFPGVYSAYVLRTLGPAGLAKVVPCTDRSAKFVAVLGLRRGRAPPRLFQGRIQGTISMAPRGRGGFGFDPIFVPSEDHRTFAEMGTKEKDRVSHRARALEAALRYLKAEEQDRRKIPRGRKGFDPGERVRRPQGRRR